MKWHQISKKPATDVGCWGVQTLEMRAGAEMANSCAQTIESDPISVGEARRLLVGDLGLERCWIELVYLSLNGASHPVRVPWPRTTWRCTSGPHQPKLRDCDMATSAPRRCEVADHTKRRRTKILKWNGKQRKWNNTNLFVVLQGVLGMKSERMQRTLLEMLELDSCEYVRIQVIRTLADLGLTGIKVMRALRSLERTEGSLSR